MTRPSGLQTEESRRTLGRLFAPIQAEMADAEQIFQDELGSRFPFVQALVEHCGDYQGKRLRPALVLLSAGACGRTTPAHPVLAAVVEMVHTATLVHDDVLDESMVRRHAATVNAEWGNETAVMLGDYLFAHAYHLAASLDSTLACRWVGKAANEVCEGEMQQLHHRGNLDLDEPSYYEIIAGKTAALTAVSCRLGAHYAGAEQAVVDSLEAYGSHVGMAFQIADDVLDIWGDERATGKSLGTDLEKQKLTLPLIRLLEIGDPATVEETRRLLLGARADSRRRLQPLLEDSGALDYAWAKARWHVEQALASLEVVAPSPYRDVLSAMAEYVVRRNA
ncbi:polyprenyl synthetase family protein [Planctomyces sp. SH-PL62]|uniref:polyprenyl synthetase family protein n=1 Tax=Planctomyces sp. SH-PL62 TaxID=1636152 RepID=UPI00078C1719|nr:polyprenyl synthetase family protein [Planctomyces sp. SH-PL62]AMV37247.1 All-trans-nonaprenyl-diphosphate synthase (geranyl-diphosphate specific) [Planctomyces sp. SH-PL62]